MLKSGKNLLKNYVVKHIGIIFPIFDTLVGAKSLLGPGGQVLTGIFVFLTLYYIGFFVIAAMDLSLFNGMISVSSLNPLISKSLSVSAVLVNVGM